MSRVISDLVVPPGAVTKVASGFFFPVSKIPDSSDETKAGVSLPVRILYTTRAETVVLVSFILSCERLTPGNILKNIPIKQGGSCMLRYISRSVFSSLHLGVYLLSGLADYRCGNTKLPFTGIVHNDH